MLFDEHFIQGVVPGAVILQKKIPADPVFCVDSRVLEKGNIFVALPGAQCDGHDFVLDVLKKGAGGAIISHEKKDLIKKLQDPAYAHTFIMAVPDTLDALTRLAVAWRAQFSYPVLAITGSVGKTSTKERIAAILDAHEMPYVASQKNYNTRIGVALTMLRMRTHHKVALVEVGISQRGEMAELAKLLSPTAGLITCIGHSHMEGLGTLADIAQEKRDLFKYFTGDSIGIINGDQPVLSRVGYAHPVIKFGTKTINQVQARKISVRNGTASFILKLYKEKYRIVLGQMHDGVVNNCLAAAAAAHLLGVPHEVIVKGLHTQITVSGRFEKRALKGHNGYMINDSYNANPESMKSAILAFQKIDASAEKIAVLGDMLELGANSAFWHRQLGRFLRKAPSLKHVILVGSMVSWTKKTLPVWVSAEIVPTWQDAAELLKKRLQDDALVLVKGSHGMGLTNLVNHLSDSI